MKVTTKPNEVLIAERKKRLATQQQFAEIIGISQSFYAQLENGTREPSFAIAKKIALITNMKIGELFKKYQ